MTDIHKEFVQAMQQFRMCILKDIQNKERLVEPYGIFISAHKKVMYCCYQLSGFSKSDEIPNWRNISVEDVKEVSISSRSFRKRKDFNPDNKKVYYQWVEQLT